MWPGRKSLARRIGCTSGFPNWWCYTGGVPWLSEPSMWNDGSISHAYPFFLHVYLQKRHGKVKMFFFKMEHRTSWYLLEAKSVYWKLQCPGCFLADAWTLLDILGQSYAWKQIHNPRHVFGRKHTIAASQALLDGHGILKAMDKFNPSKPKPNQEHTWDRYTRKIYIIKPSNVELYMLAPALFAKLKAPIFSPFAFDLGVFPGQLQGAI